MKRIKDLIDNVGNKQPSRTDDSVVVPSHFYYKQNLAPSNYQADRDSIESIDPAYYKPDSDPKSHELLQLPADFQLQIIEEKRNILCQQLAAVTKKLSEVILENQPSYSKELKHVQDLQKSLGSAFVICSNGRRYLKTVSTRISKVSLGLLSNQQKLQKLIALFDALSTIKTLQCTDVRLREMLLEEDYANAIQLCLECQQAALTYRHYHCIKDLSSKMQDTLEQIEEQIDVALSKTCENFDPDMYSRLQLSYQQLGKTESAVDQLLMHYTTCIHNNAFKVVLGFVALSNDTAENAQKKHFKEICSQVKADCYIPCLIDLCKGMFRVMQSYYHTLTWHNTHDSAERNDDDDDDDIRSNYVCKKLQHGLTRVWSDVQSRLRTYLLSTDFTMFKYDDFIFILDVVKRFIQVGRSFFQLYDNQDDKGFDSSLEKPLHQVTLTYFHSYHQARMDELLMFLGNEAWQACPVKQGFDVLGMAEFKFLQTEFEIAVDKMETDQNPDYTCYFSAEKASSDPFSEFADALSISENDSNNNKDQMTSSSSVHNSYEVGGGSDDEDDDTAAELLQDFIDEENTGNSNSVPSSVSASRSSSMYSFQQADGQQQMKIFTNTALHVLRLCGSYLKMCDVLKPITGDVIVRMTQLFDLYFYAVVAGFSSPKARKDCKLGRLQAVIHRIEESLFYPPGGAANNKLYISLQHPTISPVVNTSDPSTMFSMNERIIAMESLVSLGEQYEKLKPFLEKTISADRRIFLQQFYSQTITVSADVGKPICYDVIINSINFTSTVEKMVLVNWDVNEIMSQHSRYVDDLLHSLHNFHKSLTSAVRFVQIPESTMRIIWQECATLANISFVEGFSNARRCTNEGRALMLLDYQQFITKLEKLSGIRPNREYVESFIKAYYLTDSDLENWMKNHPEYTPKQLQSLVNTSASIQMLQSTNSQRAKQRMMSLIDEITNRK